ncbi:hypothetical protein EDB84DRAFT_1599672 [Lactarius hengduanensis]|nr:hypothetical protein EDB84DRAFT_1599672 [Lactarius hengduanensis]
MYYDDDDDDDDPYAPRTGPAAMPSPRSKFAPYYSGHANTFEDFLDEFEGRAYDCALTDPQRVDVIIRYVDPSLRDFWRSLSGYHSRDWPQLRQSLIDIFGNPTPRHQIMRQKLHSCIQETSRTRMHCEDDVLRYYRQFICFGIPLVHAGHMSEEERDAAFWYGFHPEDRKVIQPRLLGKNPFQPPDIPFHFKDVFVCARAAFAYDGSSFWSHVKQFQSPSVRREQPVVEPIPRDFYSFRAVTCSIASNAEIMTTPDELSPSSHSTPDSDLPHSLISPSESPYTQAPSVTVDQPEPAYTLSSTLLPSASFPTPSHTSSLARSDAEILSVLPLSSIMPASTMPSISSDFEYLSSATVDQPAPTLSSTPPSSSSISPTFLPSATQHQSEPEPTPTLLPSIPTLPITPSHVHSAIDNFAFTPSSLSTFLPSPARLATEDHPEPESASTPPIALSSLIHPLTHSPSSPSTDDVPEFAAAPTSSPSISSTFLSSPARSAMNSQPESEHEAAPTSMSAPLLSLPLSTLHPLSPLSSTFLPSPVTFVTEEQPEPESEPASTSESPVSKFGLSPRTLSLPPDETLAPLLSSSTLSSSPLLDISTLDSLPVALSPDQSLLSGTLSQLSRSRELESSTPVSAADVVTLSHPELPLSSPGEAFPLPASLEAPPIAPISPNSSLPQRPPRIKTLDSDSSSLEVTSALTSPATPFVPQAQEPPMVHEVSQTFASRLPLASSPRSSPRLAHFNFALAIVIAALVSTLFNASTTLSAHSRKFWSKYEDLGNNQNGKLKTSNSRNIPAHRLRLGQLMPRAPRLVFDPGGPASNSRLPSAHAKTFDSARR